MQKIVPFIWFDDAAEPAARLYTTLVPDSAITRTLHYAKAGHARHGRPEGTVQTVEFTLGDTSMVALNGGPHHRPTPAVSYFVTLETAEAVDRFWAALAEGGTALMPLDAYDWSAKYGWLSDRWGVSWQVSLGRHGDVGRTVAPSLLFTGDRAGRAEEAMAHYTAAFPGAQVDGILRHDGSGPDAAGTVLHAQFRLGGTTFMAMDSALGHEFGFSTANSHAIMCDSQDEIDHYWAALAADPAGGNCGWIEDRFGVTWQVVPGRMIDMLHDPDPARVARVTEAFMAMRKLTLAELERAYAA